MDARQEFCSDHGDAIDMTKEDRMADVIEAGMVLRRDDIELGRKLERERIIGLVKKTWEEICSPAMEPDECNICWLTDTIIKAISGEDE
jgi:hypothetical protein